MTLREILKTIAPTTRLDIEYRTDNPFLDNDMLTGVCHYENGELISDDGDIYNLDDEMCMYKLEGDTLIVGYESEWVSG